MIQLKQMGEAKARRTKKRILYYGGLLAQVSMASDDLTQWAPPEKASRNISFVLKRRHYPSAQETKIFKELLQKGL